MGNRTGSSKRIARKKQARKAAAGAGAREGKAGSGNANRKKKFTIRTRADFGIQRINVRGSSAAEEGGQVDDAEAQMARERSALLRVQAQERMVLKEHLRKLMQAKGRLTRGDGAKKERRDMAKYIRTLQEQQKAKHAQELSTVTKQVECFAQQRLMRRLTADGSDVMQRQPESEDQLRDMFANLTT